MSFGAPLQSLCNHPALKYKSGSFLCRFIQIHQTFKWSTQIIFVTRYFGYQRRAFCKVKCLWTRFCLHNWQVQNYSSHSYSVGLHSNIIHVFFIYITVDSEVGDCECVFCQKCLWKTCQRSSFFVQSLMVLCPASLLNIKRTDIETQSVKPPGTWSLWSVQKNTEICF